MERRARPLNPYDSKLHYIGMGARHKGRAVVLLVADRDVRVLTSGQARADDRSKMGSRA